MKTFVFIVFIGLFAFTCENEKSSDRQSISGSWKVFKQNISGELESIIAPLNNALYTDISIVTPDTTKGSISGNTFFNYIWAQFEIKDEEQISFENYGGSRIMEDDWGWSFRENLLSTIKFKMSNDKLFFINSQNEPVIIFIKK